jgi:hypothetical protein
MKKFTFLGLAVVVAALGLAGIASAHMWGYGGDGTGYYGMGPGMMYGYGYGAGNVSPEKFKQFQKETASLRDKLAVKQVELNNEFTKDKPDTDRIAALQKDIVGLRTSIAKAADKAGLDTDTDTSRGWGRRGYYGMGPGMMYGGGYGCGW